MDGIVPETLRVAAVQPFSPLDFPGRLSAVFFLAGCPWRCPYCHNPELQRRGRGGLPWPRLAAWLEARRGLLDAVVISGGEPTASPHLSALAAALRARGFAVGLHSAGAVPERLAAALPYLDWVGFDVKAPFAAYARITGRTRSGDVARRALDILRESGVAHEIRTTLDPALLDEAALLALARDLARHGVRHWVLQARAEGGRAAPLDLSPALITALRAEVPEIAFRH